MAPRPGTPPPAAPAGVVFGALEAYSGGRALPEGDYAVWFDARIHQPTNKSTGQAYGQPNLGVMLTCVDLRDPQAEPKEKFISMGRKAKETFMPNADGSGLVLVPGGPAGNLNNQTNWFFFLKSLYDCAMPEGVFVNDFNTINGIWVHIANVPEPEDRKNFNKGAKTGDVVEEEERKGDGLMPVVSEILEGGKPWEGGGGMPAAPINAAPPKPVSPAPRPGPVPVAAAPARPAPARPGPTRVAAPAPVAAAADTGDLQEVALNALGEVLAQDSLKSGGLKLTLRTDFFKHVKKTSGDEVANAAMNAYFASDDKLNELLNVVGYSVSGSKLVLNQ